MKKISYDKIKNAYLNKGYKFFEGELNINLFAVRDVNAKADDKFDCTFGVAYEFKKMNMCETFSCTTIPGIFWLKKFFNEQWGGTAIMAEGQFRNSFVIGKQHGHDALIQCKAIPVYRDGNKDLIYDKNPSTIMKGIFSTNIHRAGTNSQIIGNWSAGCQVLQKSADMDRIIYLCRESAKIYGNVFTYTLFADDEVI